VGAIYKPEALARDEGEIGTFSMKEDRTMSWKKLQIPVVVVRVLQSSN
jgi:hypothetical protein